MEFLRAEKTSSREHLNRGLGMYLVDTWEKRFQAEGTVRAQTLGKSILEGSRNSVVAVGS